MGSIIGFLGAAFGTVGGVGGGGIFVPMLTLIIGFDAKSSTAISKCMITGGAATTVFYNLKLRHPTLEMPIIDYDLALLLQPMLVLGISIGVAFNVILAYWMITVLLIVIFLVVSSKAFLKGVETWKKETLIKKEAAKQLESDDDTSNAADYMPLPGSSSNGTQPETKKSEVSFLENVHWKDFGILVAVWFIILTLEIVENYSTTCSVAYWVLNLLQFPVAISVTSYKAISLYKTEKDRIKGRRRHKLESTPADYLQWLWRFSWSWRRVHLRSTFSRAGNPSSGVKCHSNVCNDIFCTDVSCGVLPSRSISSPLRSILCWCGDGCCVGRTACCKKDY